MQTTKRADWALARIGEVVNEGRRAGWLPGHPLDGLLDSERLRHDESGHAMTLAGDRLGLASIEIDLLWLLAMIEIEPHVAQVAQLLMGSGMHELSAQMVQRLVPCDDESIERLAALALVETTLDSRIPQYRRGIRVSDRVVDLARGRYELDRSIRMVARLESAAEILRASADEEVTGPLDLTRVLESREAWVIATGPEGSGRATVLSRLVSVTGRGVLIIAGDQLADREDEIVRQLRAIHRECRLHEVLPLLRDADALGDRAAIVDRELLRRFPGAVLATAREACTWRTSRTMTVFPVKPLDIEARQRLWSRKLPGIGETVLSECARRYSVTPGTIARAAAAAKARALDPHSLGADDVHAALRAQLEKQLSGLARRIETTQTWDDLVLPVEQFDLLIELVARVRHRQQVLDQWGFAAKVGRGLGTSALFSGPPGTGKTMIAGLVAKELGLDQYQVDLSKVVSKYIGETEKQLAALFEAAESGHAILLFDEADSLFAKRTEVKSSNDRYANLEVNYLLQRIEAFSGITILTTNHESAIDPAFLRRLAFHVRVPLPDERQRELLWKCMIPEQAERAADIDFGGLATRFEMSGGYIKNAVLRAAFLSADQNTAITNEHLWRAARAEYEAMGKLAL